LLQQKQDEVRERNKEIEEGVFQATNDPRHPAVAPKTEEVAPFINFAPLDNVITELTKAAEAYKKAYDDAGPRGDLTKASASAQELNHLLMESERRLTNPDGLPGRSWFKHEIYAPGQYTGYEAKTIPGVREALELKHWKEAEEQVGVAAKTLQQEVALINEAGAKLSALH
jgi:N-acetylated-alpha-linked acidic dipeptidase